jgi:hypothetical protein
MSRITRVDPADYPAIVGSTFIKHEQTPVLVIGSRSWSRYSLGRLGCPHPVAAAALNRVVQELRITTIAGLAQQAHVIGAYKGLGVTAYWTVLAILREAGYDVAEVHGEPVTYHTIKRRATRAAAKRTSTRTRRGRNAA